MNVRFFFVIWFFGFGKYFVIVVVIIFVSIMFGIIGFLYGVWDV